VVQCTNLVFHIGKTCGIRLQFVEKRVEYGLQFVLSNDILCEYACMFYQMNKCMYVIIYIFKYFNNKKIDEFFFYS
jgi:hypothetical protein